MRASRGTGNRWSYAAAEFKNGKVIQAQAYLDPKEALEAAGLRDQG